MNLLLYKKVLDEGLDFYSQPIVKVSDQSIVGYELLARLRVGDSILTPDAFLTDVFSNDLYAAVDSKLAQKVLGFCLSDNSNRFLSINIPSLESLSYHINHEGLGKYSSRIHLELLESVEWSDPEHVLLIEKAALRGFKVYLDDFGNGQSNLKTLLNDGVAGIKIDRSVFLKYFEDGRSESLNALVEFIFDLNKQVIFEGVEFEEHSMFLKQISQSVMAQGFFYGKPVGGRLEH